MMKLTDEHISEIADLLDCGMICFYHRPSGKIESHPDPYDPYFEPEFWQDIIDKIENDKDNYVEFEKMDSREAFRMMENFAYSLNDKKFSERILNQLAKPKPFRNFKNLIDYSDYRQQWFDFKKETYIEFVKRQIKRD